MSLHRAVKLAEENRAELTAIDVLRALSSLFQAFSGSGFSDGLQQDLLRQREEELRNLNILQIATSLAKLESAELHVVHAWSLWAESILKSRTPVDQFQKMLQEQEEASAEALGGLLEPFNLTVDSPQVMLIHGTPDCVIPHVVHHNQVELLVMGTVCRTGIPGFVIGNTAEYVLSDVDCSVLTLKPEEFQSPVTLMD